jgi:hypothetical protein
VADDESRLADLGKTTAERLAGAVVPAGGLVWTAAEIMHLAGTPGAKFLAGATAVLTLAAWGAAGRRDDVPPMLYRWTATVGGWVTAASALGPLHWLPAAPLTIAWAVIVVAARRAAHAHESVVSARRWREAREDWLARRHDWGLGGSHLLDFEETRLGELYTVGTKGTRRRASHFVGAALEEVIAEAENLPLSRVRVMGHRLAGRIRISIRRVDPWAEALLHPLACDDHEISLPGSRSILDEAVVGQDPETGEPLTVPLYDENGARRVSVTGISGAGKGVLIDDLMEHVTACRDAVAVHLNLSIKGYEDEASWGPACHLTAYGPERKARAAAILKTIAEILEWRTRNFKRGTYVPSPEHPAFIIFADESDTATAAVREGLTMIATKGRSHGAGYVHVGQRNTREYTDPKARSQDNVFCTGMVRSANEDRHAGTGTGPSMATYGEGRPGVWKIERLGGGQRVGRTWVFSASPARHGAEVERIAQERAFAQPELHPDCRAFLGDDYEELLRTDVFARWARAQDEPEDEEAPGSPAGPAPAPERAPAGDDGSQAGPEPATSAVAVADDDIFSRMERELDEQETAAFAALNEKLGGVRRMVEETAAMPRHAPVDPEKLAAVVAGRWRQAGDEAQIPAEALATLLGLLRRGTTIGEVAEACSVKVWTARTWLQKLRDQGTARLEGTGRGARWLTADDAAPET